MGGGGGEEKVWELIKEKCSCVLEVQLLHKELYVMIIMKNDRADNNNNDRDVVDHGWRSTNIHSLKPQDSALR